MRMKSDTGLKSIALFEAFKGLVVLAVGLGLLRLMNRDLAEFGESVCKHLHLNPAHKYPHIFIAALEHLQNTNLLLLATGAFAYSALRLIEAYGLWHARPWAEWLAIFSGGIYLPVELIELFGHYSHLKLAITVLNLALVIYLLRLRLRRDLPT
jgi:uncharacterized membrane protein (DUF2068 family)